MGRKNDSITVARVYSNQNESVYLPRWKESRVFCWPPTDQLVPYRELHKGLISGRWDILWLWQVGAPTVA